MMTSDEKLNRVISFRQWLMDRHVKHMRDEEVYRDEGELGEARRQQRKAQLYEEIVVRLDKALDDS